MNRISHALLLAAALTCGAAGVAQAQKFDRQIVDRYEQSFPMRHDATLVVHNPVGSITLTGTSHQDMKVIAERVIRGVDDGAVREGRTKASLVIEGNEASRQIRAVHATAEGSARWGAHFNYNIRVPQSIDVTLVTGAGERIRVVNTSGTLRIKNVSGDLQVVAPRGPVVVESINGSVRLHYHTSPGGHARVSSVNGDVSVSVPSNATFRWIAETLRGDFLATLPIAGKFVPVNSGRQYEGLVGSVMPSSPRIHASSVTGRVFLLRAGTAPAQAVALREGGARRQPTRVADAEVASAAESLPIGALNQQLIQPPAARSFAIQQGEHDGDFVFPAGIGNVFVGHVRGSARILGRAGEVVLGSVSGDCRVQSLGGPINIGDVMGSVDLQTGAGDVLVRAARSGGRMATQGGNIQLVYAGAPIRLESGGGDIVLRQAAGSVVASTRSGDINVRAVDSAKSLRMDLSTVGGSIQLVLPPHFAADIDATVIAPASEERNIITEFPGLTITRETLGAQVRIRATGTINGGGQKVELRSEGGNILLRRSTR